MFRFNTSVNMSQLLNYNRMFLPVQLRCWNIHEIFSTVISLMVKYLLLTKHDFLLSNIILRLHLAL